jgi:hypothetical protein
MSGTEFVQSAWNSLITNPIFANTSKWTVWSDGGPHHFKISVNIRFMQSICEDHDKQITYNFFASYHGDSVCDGAAATAKRLIKKCKKDYHEYPVNTESDIVSCINESLLNTAQITPEQEENDFDRIVAGIRSFHKFELGIKGVGDKRTWIFGFENERTLKLERWRVL